jgi:hypothetical protein
MGASAAAADPERKHDREDSPLQSGVWRSQWAHPTLPRPREHRSPGEVFAARDSITTDQVFADSTTLLPVNTVNHVVAVHVCSAVKVFKQ